ncbi:MAG: hypothetical protein WAS24_01425 [Thermoplasmata archaeon]
MTTRGTRGAYRKEDRIALPPELQKELVEKAATKYGNCQELAKHLNIPKSSVHYYRIGRLTMPISILNQMLQIAGDKDLEERIAGRGITKDRTWANEHAISVLREMCRDKLRLPTKDELEKDDDLRRKAAAIVSYVLAEGSVWLQKQKWGECAVNVTFAAHETDLYDHFRSLCRDVFLYEIGPPQKPGNGAVAIRGFIYSRFVAEWLIENGVLPGDKSSRALHLPRWVMRSNDEKTLIAALQPWCDGEGSVSSSRTSKRPQFLISQSRHTDLDTGILRLDRCPTRNLCRSALKKMIVFDMSAYEYCSALSRSDILDDVSKLFERLGIKPRTDIMKLYLKDDGFWSCVWQLRFSGWDAQRMLSQGLISQARKKDALNRNHAPI